MPDGRTYAGDTPPPECKVKSQYADTAPEPPAPPAGPEAAEAAESDRKTASANASESQALPARRRIEAEANAAAEELAETRAKLSQYANSLEGTDPTTRALLRDEGREALQTRERELLKKIEDTRAQFAELTSRLTKERGSLPASWPRAMRCDRCP
jgi:hypothetical protein